MGGSSSPPPPPDPAVTAAAQTKTNKETAEFQAGINRSNQNTAQGSVEWNKIGEWDDGSPRYESNQTLSPQEQNIYDLNAQARSNVGQIGVEQSGRIGELLNKPIYLGNDAVEGRLFDLGRQRLDPMFAEKQQRMEQDLANKGIHRGSEAYDRAVRNQNYSENDAFNQLLLQGRGQSVQEQFAERNQMINESSALMSGSQVSQPNFVGSPQTGVANTDVASIYNKAYKNDLAAWQAEENSNNAMTNGLFGLGAAGLRMIPYSDRRVKIDVVATGNKGPRGLSEYDWTYIWGGERHRGFMADDVLGTHPGAVWFGADGVMRLDYGSIV